MQTEELYANWRSIHSADEVQSRTLYRSKNYLCRLKNYLQIVVQLADWRIIADQISIPSTGQRIICRSKNYVQIEVQFADQRIISKSNNNLQIQFRSADRRILDQLIMELSANQSSIYRQFFNLQKNSLICWFKFDLKIEIFTMNKV